MHAENFLNFAVH